MSGGDYCLMMIFSFQWHFILIKKPHHSPNSFQSVFDNWLHSIRYNAWVVLESSTQTLNLCCCCLLPCSDCNTVLGRAISGTTPSTALLVLHSDWWQCKNLEDFFYKKVSWASTEGFPPQAAISSSQVASLWHWSQDQFCRKVQRNMPVGEVTLTQEAVAGLTFPSR